jgi:LruC domain-containing protein
LIFSDYAGLVSEVRLPIEGSNLNFDYSSFYERDEVSGKEKVLHRPFKYPSSLSGKADFTYIDTYDGSGVPDNLVFPDVIQQNLLDDINASLPENVPGGIPNSNPEFLAGKETNLILTEEADVWVTFVSEGAGYRNSLGYYTYTLGNEPATVDDINHLIIYPNVSMVGSGGGLVPGDRVYLGRFPANTVVAWFLVANGWTGSITGNGNGIYYSDPDFNPESTEATRTHMVLLHDAARDLTLLGFEDLRRDVATDDDFNDAVFYARSNPVDAIQIGNLAQIEVANDSDGDGVNDELDDFPFDPNQAFNNFSPSANSTGTLVYEDLWPNQGDYDFNDLVVDYNFNSIANADNLITTLEGTFSIVHIGGAFHNGFGFLLPISPDNIASITGQNLNGGYETVAANGTETGTATNETVVYVVGDAFDLEGQTLDITVNFSTPQDQSALGDVPYNAFLIVNGDRTREVHLPDLAPTSKAQGLGTEDDFSDAANNRYYKTATNLPWAMNIYDAFTPPPESIPITIQYPRFVNWANSGGTQDLDWYIR